MLTGRRDDTEESSDYENLNPESATGTNVNTTASRSRGIKWHLQ